MKSLGELMAEMGFRKDASDGVKEAFLKHLIQNATGFEVRMPTEKEKTQEAEQLTFEFYQDQSQKKAKVS